MKLKFTVTAKSPQSIEVDPADYVGMSETEVWSRITDLMFEEAEFTVGVIAQSSIAFRDAWREQDRDAAECGICGETFRKSDEIVSGDKRGQAHASCYRKA